MTDQRLRHEVDIQAEQIRRVFAQHQLDVELVEGDVVQDDHGRETSFGVRAKLAAGWQQAQALARDLQQALGQEVLVEDEEGHLKINLFQRDKPPVELLDVLELVPDVPLLTAVLGWADNDNPLWLDFDSAEAAHALLAGQTGAGKTMLLRTIALSLALNNRERELQLAIISIPPDTVPLRQRQELQPLEYLPHMLCPIATNQPDAQQLLQFLGEEARYRLGQGIVRPHIILLVDHLAELLWRGGTTAVEQLTYLLRQGASAGIHLVLSLEGVDTAVVDPTHLEDLLDAHLPTRLVGRLPDAEQAEIATDVYESGAEQLTGAGDFLAVVGERMVHFQAAFVSDYDFHLCLEHLYAQRPPALLAQPYDPRPRPRARQAEMRPEHYHFSWSSHLMHEPQPVSRISQEVKAVAEPPEVTTVKPVKVKSAEPVKPVIRPVQDTNQPPVMAEPVEAEPAKPVIRPVQDTNQPPVMAEPVEAEPAKPIIRPVQDTNQPPVMAEPVEAEPIKPIIRPVQDTNQPPVMAEPVEAEPLPLPEHWPWADMATEDEDDEIPFDWLAVEPVSPQATQEVTEPVAQQQAVEPNQSPVVAESVEATPFDFDFEREPDPAESAGEDEADEDEEEREEGEINTAVRNLLKWHKRLPQAQQKRITKVNEQ